MDHCWKGRSVLRLGCGHLAHLNTILHRCVPPGPYRLHCMSELAHLVMQYNLTSASPSSPFVQSVWPVGMQWSSMASIMMSIPPAQRIGTSRSPFGYISARHCRDEAFHLGQWHIVSSHRIGAVCVDGVNLGVGLVLHGRTPSVLGDNVLALRGAPSSLRNPNPR